MTIQTIEILNLTAEIPVDAADTVTRADVTKGEIRLFAGRKVQVRLPLPEGASEEAVAGILAGATFPTSEAALKGLIEDSLAEVETRRGSVIPDDYRYGYGVDQNNGDDIALLLKEFCGGGLKEPMDLAKLETVVDANGIRDRFDVWMAKDLNPGMLRMNTGNVLRGKVRRAEPVRIGTRVWNSDFVGPVQPAPEQPYRVGDGVVAGFTA